MCPRDANQRPEKVPHFRKMADAEKWCSVTPSLIFTAYVVVLSHNCRSFLPCETTGEIVQTGKALKVTNGCPLAKQAIITIAQQKGGSGKTTLASNLAIAFLDEQVPRIITDSSFILPTTNIKSKIQGFAHVVSRGSRFINIINMASIA